MKPESKKVTVEWKYSPRRKRKRSTFIGVEKDLVGKGLAGWGLELSCFDGSQKLHFVSGWEPSQLKQVARDIT